MRKFLIISLLFALAGCASVSGSGSAAPVEAESAGAGNSVTL